MQAIIIVLAFPQGSLRILRAPGTCVRGPTVPQPEVQTPRGFESLCGSCEPKASASVDCGPEIPEGDPSLVTSPQPERPDRSQDRVWGSMGPSSHWASSSGSSPE